MYRHCAKVVPPFRFAAAEVGVYRGAYPTLKNFTFLKSLELKTIISLIPEQSTEDLSDFCDSEGIEHIHKMVEKRKEDVTVSIKDVAEVVSIIIRRSKLPVYIHCLDGSETTGLVICCLRRLQAWHPECAVNEYCRFSRHGEMSKDEEKFVKSFKEVEIAEDDPPEWLWKTKLPGTKLPVEPHPSIKLIKHSGGQIEVVPPKSATQATRKETKQVTNSLPPLMGAMKRTKKATADGTADADGDATAARAAQQRTQQRDRPPRDTAHAAAGGFRPDGPATTRTGSPAATPRDQRKASVEDADDDEDDDDDDGEGEEEEEDEEDYLVSYPSLLEALSLHNFSDISKHGSGGPRLRDGL